MDFSMKYELEWKMDRNSFIHRPKKGGRKLVYNLVDSIIICRDTWTQYITRVEKVTVKMLQGVDQNSKSRETR